MILGRRFENARTIRALATEHGSFRAWLDSLPAGDLANYQKVFRKTFRFCGPEITRMFVMASDLVHAPHDPRCWRADERARR
jgi:DNA-3-methyladenine glycosylase I